MTSASADRKHPYRVVVWGPGGIGSALIREALALPELELVGVYVYSQSKHDRDAGDLVGLPSCGVKATSDRSAIFALKPDVVFVTARDYGNFHFDDDVYDVLANGCNVITSLPYQNVEMRGPEVIEKLEAACKKGKSTFFATGINPGFMFERLALTATGITNGLQRLSLQEFVKIGTEPPDTLNAFGFGLPESEAAKNEVVPKIAEQYERQFLYYAGDLLGLPVERLERTTRMVTAKEAFQAPTMLVEAGQVTAISHLWRAHSGGRVPFTFEVNWYMTDDMRPPEATAADFYLITIEGRPSLRLGVELFASADQKIRLYPGDPTTPVVYATAVPMTQAVPAVVAASPGIKRIEPPSNGYWKTDMRA